MPVLRDGSEGKPEEVLGSDVTLFELERPVSTFAAAYVSNVHLIAKYSHHRRTAPIYSFIGIRIGLTNHIEVILSGRQHAFNVECIGDMPCGISDGVHMEQSSDDFCAVFINDELVFVLQRFHIPQQGLASRKKPFFISDFWAARILRDTSFA